MTDKTLQERLRFELSRIADEECYDGGSHQLMFLRQSEARELRDALDAQAKVLRAFVEADDDYEAGDISTADHRLRLRNATAAARALLGEK